MKNMFKKIFVSLFVFCLSFLIVSCQNQKTTKNSSIQTNNSIDNTSDNTSDNNVENLTEKEKQSGRFEKIKDSKNVKTTESKIETWEIKDPNISPNWWGTPAGWVDTWANPLDL